MRMYFHLHNTTYSTPIALVPNALMAACTDILTSTGGVYIPMKLDSQLPVSECTVSKDIQANNVINTTVDDLMLALQGKIYMPTSARNNSAEDVKQYGQHFFTLKGDMYYYWGRLNGMVSTTSHLIGTLQEDGSVKVLKDVKAAIETPCTVDDFMAKGYEVLTDLCGILFQGYVYPAQVTMVGSTPLDMGLNSSNLIVIPKDCNMVTALQDVLKQHSNGQGDTTTEKYMEILLKGMRRLAMVADRLCNKQPAATIHVLQEHKLILDIEQLGDGWYNLCLAVQIVSIPSSGLGYMHHAAIREIPSMGNCG